MAVPVLALVVILSIIIIAITILCCNKYCSFEEAIYKPETNNMVPKKEEMCQAEKEEKAKAKEYAEREKAAR